MTPSQAVKIKCVDCLGLNQFNQAEVKACQGDTCKTGPCPIFPFRLGKRIPVRVFRWFCIQCMGGQRHLVADCPSIKCAVYPYRLGTNPARQGIGNHCFKMHREFMKSSRQSKEKEMPIPYNMRLSRNEMRELDDQFNEAVKYLEVIWPEIEKEFSEGGTFSLEEINKIVERIDLDLDEIKKKFPELYAEFMEGLKE